MFIGMKMRGNIRKLVCVCVLCACVLCPCMYVYMYVSSFNEIMVINRNMVQYTEKG